MSRSKAFIYSSAGTVGLQLVTLLSGIIIPKMTIKYYGSEINGLIVSISQIIYYFSFVEAGLAGAAVYSLFEPLSTNDIEKTNRIIATASSLYIKTGLWYIVLTIGLSFVYPSVIKDTNISYLRTSILIIALGANGAFEYFAMAKYRVLLFADQKNHIVSLASIIQITAQTIIVVIMSIMRIDIISMRYTAAFTVILRYCVLKSYVSKYYNKFNYNIKPDRRLIEKRWDALWQQILGSTQLSFPIILATIYTDLKTVSIFSVYNMVISGISGLLGMFVNGATAPFGDMVAKREVEALKLAYSQFELLFYSVLTVVFSVAGLLILPFVKLYIGTDADINYSVPIIGYLVVINGWLHSVKTPQGMLIISTGMYKETRIQSTIQAVIIIVFGIVFANRYGLIGILLAMCCSNIYRVIDLMIFVPKRITGTGIGVTARRILKMLIINSMIWLMSYWVSLNINSVGKWIIVAILATLFVITLELIYLLLFEKIVFRSLLCRARVTIRSIV